MIQWQAIKVTTLRDFCINYLAIKVYHIVRSWINEMKSPYLIWQKCELLHQSDIVGVFYSIIINK